MSVTEPCDHRRVPIRHVVLWAFRDAVPGVERDALLEDLRGLGVAVPVLRSIAVGPNLSLARAQGYTHVMIQTFDDRGGLEAYQVHPAHVPVATRLREAAAQMCVVDLEA